MAVSVIKQVSKKQQAGVAPAVILIDPKYSHNVGAVIRAASCYGVKQVWMTGNRIKLKDGERIPREERMKGYKEVELFQYDYPFDQFPRGVIPVAVELREGAEMLQDFVHEPNMVYCFGPEDGSIPGIFLKHCHRIVALPTHFCTNLSAAVYTVLYDRRVKLMQAGQEPQLTTYNMLKEHRGYVEPDYEQP